MDSGAGNRMSTVKTMKFLANWASLLLGSSHSLAGRGLCKIDGLDDQLELLQRCSCKMTSFKD